MTVDMKHLEYLQRVADSDVILLKEKEATYKGSWKMAGGRSAWFMFRRNMDRLQNMMAAVPWPESFSREDLRDAATENGPERKRHIGYELTSELADWMLQKLSEEDVFEKIHDDPSGRDGTVLACLRDLRRYATLIEAEMISRGAVIPERENKIIVSPRLTTEEARRMSEVWDGTSTKVEDCIMKQGTPENEWVVAKPGTPEDGGQHESLAPWVMTDDVINNVMTQMHIDTWYRRVGPLWVLEASVCNPKFGEPPALIRSLYDFKPTQGNLYVVKIALCPLGAREYFPKFQEEANRHEWEKMQEWVATLYEWNPSDEKHHLIDRAWEAET